MNSVEKVRRIMMKQRNFWLSVIATTLLLSLSVSPSLAKGNPSPNVVPPNARIQGKTYGEWNAIVYQTLFAIPADQNPGIGAPWSNCFLKQVGNVGVGVVFMMQTGTFACQMPSGMPMFLSIVGYECSTLEPEPFYGANPEELLACAQNFGLSELSATIDGVALENPDQYVSTSPVFDLYYPEDNVVGIPAGTGLSVAHQFSLMFTPFPPGKHVLHVQGTVADFSYVYDWTYNILVTPED
jgi:hypothetical protein